MQEISIHPTFWAFPTDYQGTLEIKPGGTIEVHIKNMHPGDTGIIHRKYNFNGKTVDLGGIHPVLFTANEAGQAIVGIKIPNPQATEIEIDVRVWKKGEEVAYCHFHFENLIVLP